MQITYIGTGAMGKPMISQLIEHGYTVKVTDKYKSAAETVITKGAIWADTPKEAATGSDVVITCLPLPHHVYENMVGPDGALEGMKKDSIWIDTSTTDYHNTLKIEALGIAKGVISLEAPVSNLSHMGADFANTSIYVGGNKAAFERIKDILNTISKVSFHVSGIGKAQTVKLITNLYFYSATVICGECFALAQEAGIPLHWMWDYSKQTKAFSIALEQFMPFLFDKSYDKSCTLEIGHKDMNLTSDLAKELNVKLPTGNIIRAHYDETIKRYNSQDGHIIVCKVTEDDNNISLQIPNFVAPSKYGANPNYIRSEEMIEDKWSRIKPKIPESYKAKDYYPSSEQQELIDSLIEYMTFINYLINEECYNLGIGMGLSKELLKEVIFWSVGTCWIADNFENYSPDNNILKKIQNIKTNLKLRTTERIIS